MTHLALGASWSQALRALLAEAPTETLVDFVEVSLNTTLAEIAELRPRLPLVLHCAGSPVDEETLAPARLALLQRYLAATGSPFLVLHVGSSAARVRLERNGIRIRAVPAGPVLSYEETLDRLVHAVTALQRQLAVPLLLENYPYYPTGAYEHICRPEFLAAVVARTGCGLLLDLAHARIAAAHLGLPVRTYLDALPLEAVRAVHVCGPRRSQGTLEDAHEPLLLPDYALLRRLLGQNRLPQATHLTLEYWRDPTALIGQIRRLRAILAATDHRPEAVRSPVEQEALVPPPS